MSISSFLGIDPCGSMLRVRRRRQTVVAAPSVFCNRWKDWEEGVAVGLVVFKRVLLLTY